MFSGWTDPNDIDNYFGGVNELFRDIPSSPSSNTLMMETPVGIVQNLSNKEATEKSTYSEKFDLEPNSIVDNHTVGKQPIYNILRSGPPKQESYRNNYNGGCKKMDVEYIYIVLIFVFVCMYISYLHNQLTGARMTNSILMAAMMNTAQRLPPIQR
jgi:hypothetical protein